MKIIAGIDIGNASTETALARIENGKAVFLFIFGYKLCRLHSFFKKRGNKLFYSRRFCNGFCIELHIKPPFAIKAWSNATKMNSCFCNGHTKQH